jgi:hypothetical protein
MVKQRNVWESIYYRVEASGVLLENSLVFVTP